MWMIMMGLVIFLLLILGGLFYAFYQRVIQQEERYSSLEKTVAQLFKDHPVLIHADLIFSRQLKDINSQLISMDHQLQSLENQRANDGGYQHALRILEMGGSKEEIVTSCHLSNAEADLFMNLHAYRSAIKRQHPL